MTKITEEKKHRLLFKVLLFTDERAMVNSTVDNDFDGLIKGKKNPTKKAAKKATEK